jgi:hypothetical protein
MSYDVDAQHINTSPAIAIASGVCSIWSLFARLDIVWQQNLPGIWDSHVYGREREDNLVAFPNKLSPDDQLFSNIAGICSEPRP